jgi:predicted DNA-binding transcriptional regulator YafY
MIERLNSLDYYIRTKSTGTPKQLADKLNLCERQAREYISLIRQLGAPVKYDRSRNTYYYEFEGEFNFKFSKSRYT